MLGFFEANTDKSAQGYIADLNTLIKQPEVEIPVMSDNCATMKKVGKISKRFKKVNCAAHMLAKIDDKLHKIPQIEKLDSCLSKLNAYFNYRHDRFDLPLKPQTSKSTTRAWRSHQENYRVTLRNFERYEELYVSLADFPTLPDKTLLRRIAEIEKQLCDSFTTLENKNSDLLDQMKCYVNVFKLSKQNCCLSIFGDKLTEIMQMPSTIDGFLGEDTLAYCYLSKLDFEFAFADCPHLNPQNLLEKAKMRIRALIKQHQTEPDQIVYVEASEDEDEFFKMPQNESSGDQPETCVFQKFEDKGFMHKKNKFWLAYKSEMPLLFAVYVSLRSIPASNSSIERSFSIAGLIFDDLKSSTSPESIEAQITLCIDKSLK